MCSFIVEVELHSDKMSQVDINTNQTMKRPDLVSINSCCEFLVIPS